MQGDESRGQTGREERQIMEVRVFLKWRIFSCWTWPWNEQLRARSLTGVNWHSSTGGMLICTSWGAGPKLLHTGQISPLIFVQTSYWSQLELCYGSRGDCCPELVLGAPMKSWICLSPQNESDSPGLKFNCRALCLTCRGRFKLQFTGLFKQSSGKGILLATGQV